MFAPLPPSRWNESAAAHLLRRAGFGANPQEIKEWTALGVKQAVKRLVYWQDQPPFGESPAWAAEAERTKLLEEFRAARDLPEAERQEKRKQLLGQQRRQLQDLQSWWMERMIRSPRPFEEKLTLFWHGHFVSSSSKVKNPYFLYDQHVKFRAMGNGNFKDLTVAMGRDAAMLLYLDGSNSRKSAPNENYARELMELFTLGEGHYTEEDIRAAARAFTGWKVQPLRQEATFTPFAHDDERKTFKEKSGKFNDEDIVSIILEDDQCARHLAGKFWKFFVSEQPDEPAVEALARQLRMNDYALAPVFETLFQAEEFYAPTVVAGHIKSPADWIAGILRTLPLLRLPEKLAPLATQQMGQELFNPPSVKGWDGGRSWINTTTLLLRVNFAKMLLYGGKASELGFGKELLQIPDPIKDNMSEEQRQRLKQAAGQFGKRNVPSVVDWAAVQQRWPDISSPDGRAHFARGLLGFPPSARLTGTISTYFQTHPLRSGTAPSQRHYQDLAYLVLSQPEYQLC